MSVSSISIYPANFATYEENLIICGSFIDLLDAHNSKTRYDFCITSIDSAHCASFLSRWPFLRGGGMYILTWDMAKRIIS